MDQNLYKVRHHLNMPTKILSITIDELLIIIITLVMFFFLDEIFPKALLILLSGIIVGVLRYIKKGRGPKMLIVYAYWFLPSFVTKFFMVKAPASHKRVWKA